MFSSQNSQVSQDANYIEDVFSTWLYTGNSSTQTITNGIDLAGKGGLVWLKQRSGTARSHFLFDTARGALNALSSNSTSSSASTANSLTSFNSSGFSLGSFSDTNASTQTYASWTFREAPKFFDVVTFTANSSGNATFSHTLGSTPGCVILKRTDGVSSWYVWHRSLTSTNYSINLNQTGAQSDNGFAWITPESSTVSINGGFLGPNTQWVAHLFAHNAGGFGLTGTDNVISCGSFTSTGSGTITVDLGYEPQWILMKASTSSGLDWFMFDNMRGTPVGSGPQLLYANFSGSENTGNPSAFQPNATGFTAQGSYWGTNTLIYIAIRRGPMKVPTTGTSVFSPVTYTGDGASGRLISGAGFPPDLLIQTARSASENREFDDRLRGGGSTAMNALFSNSTNAEAADSGSVQLLNQDGFTVRSFGNGSGVTYVGECFRRAPGFFDEVCYTGNGATGQAINHNLGVIPELYICKRRDSSQGGDDWQVYCSYLSSPLNSFLRLVSSAGNGTNTDAWQTPTSTQIKIGAGLAGYMNASGGTYVSYLFASAPGVSKVGSYTGNGSSQTINCGFTGGARFVLIKRIDSTGDWYVWDTARGIVSGNDPHLSLNTTTAEVTTNDTIDTDSTGFVVNQVSATNVNVSSATYIFMAVA